MVVFPPCKINLGLNILSKRPDGYHAIETCFYPVPWTDILEIIPSLQFSFQTTGLPATINPEENLCVKAYRLLQQDFPMGPVHMHLHKIIPSGAGLGGGSSDAAYALRLLNQTFKLGLSGDDLQVYASRLGSDCAFFIESKPALGTGRGDELHSVEVNLSHKFVVLVKPEVHVSTADAYAGVAPGPPAGNLQEILKQDMSTWRNTLVNDFEESVFKKYPEIASIKARLYELGATYASMSGSGAAVFGIFQHEVNPHLEFAGVTSWSGFLTA